MSNSTAIPFVSRPWPRVAYGALFVVVLPLLLAIWSLRLDAVLPLPDLGSVTGGAALLVAGLALMLSAVHALWKHGHGLPMSPFPPERLVSRGPYRMVPHPIYVGAVLACAGCALAASSSAGMLVVTPVLALTAAAFVLGYEREATLQRFGALPRPLLRFGQLSRVPGVGTVASWGSAAWRAVCRAAEWIANSWREATVGPVRFLSHGIYAALGGFAGTWLAVILAGPESLWWIVSMALAAQAGAAFWAQVIEGSPQLLRPYGYFGSVGAVIVLAITAGALGADGWRLTAAFATGAGITQALGRLRCLVQGCCHGRPVDAAWGIRVTHPRSRIVRLSNLGGVPLHPTQLYSMVTTLCTTAVLLGLWLVRMPLPFIIGMYFVLTGLTRFVEEHFRGEPQTPFFAGLRLYQWLAIAFVIGGAATTVIDGPRAPAFVMNAEGWPALLALAAVTYAAYGMDFPRSSRRLSRLA